MRKTDLEFNTLYAYGTGGGTPTPIVITDLDAVRFGRRGNIGINIMKTPDLNGEVRQVSVIESARRIRGTWAEWEVDHAAAQAEQERKQQIRNAGVVAGESARKQLGELWPDSVPIPQDGAYRLLSTEHTWTPREDGALRVTLDVRTILALVKAARKEALDEFSGSGGRFQRAIDQP